jgi:hypothetical protein
MRTGPGDAAASVGAGILLSRITGLARDVSVAAFLGTGLLADAYWAAIKIPNIIRNLLGEGTLSAAFVPVYSEVLEREGPGATGPARLASSMLGLVLAVAALLSALGVILAPWITQTVMFGALADTRNVTTELVRILFPMSGVLILGAWCLGVLNSHGRFFLPFVAPTLWNLAQIGGLFLARAMGSEDLRAAADRPPTRRNAAASVGLELGASEESRPQLSAGHLESRHIPDLDSGRHLPRHARRHQCDVGTRILAAADLPAHQPVRGVGRRGLSARYVP